MIIPVNRQCRWFGSWWYRIGFRCRCCFAGWRHRIGLLEKVEQNVVKLLRFINKRKMTAPFHPNDLRHRDMDEELKLVGIYNLIASTVDNQRRNLQPIQQRGEIGSPHRVDRRPNRVGS